MFQAIGFDPALPLWLIIALAALSAAVLIVALWRGLTGWWLRALAALVLLFALAGPSLRREDRTPVPNIALVVLDDSASNRLDDRGDQLTAALDGLRAQLRRVNETTPLEVREIRVTDQGADGTKLLTALSEAVAELPADRIAGAIIVTDGQVHDPEALSSFPAPVQVLLTGHAADWDRRVVIETAPAFAIVDEAVSLTLRVEDLGAAPADAAGQATLQISLDGGAPQDFQVPLNQSVTLPVTLQRGGVNMLRVSTPARAGELTDRNNAQIVSINGVRDRLRVLLVSGEPYPGERTWRNLLKSDSSVDLVHFTILRPPDKQDYVPVFELSLIAFPTQELFMEKVDQFDLIIFDRYKRRGILPNSYFENIVRYVRDGGALLIASGADFAGAESLYRSPLRDVLPVEPTGRVIEQGFTPRIPLVGERHPVTAGLEDHAPRPTAEDGTPGWGRWFRAVEVAAQGPVVMEGPENTPLLVLQREGEGRVAVLTSDEAWLWSRGYEGGGPQMELLRRLAHWLMKEPELEEEVLLGTGDEGAVVITRRTLADTIPEVVATSPSGIEQVVPMTETAPGRWQGRIEDAENGAWRLANGDLVATAVVGPAAPNEFRDPVSTDRVLGPLAEATRGGVKRLEDGEPSVRMVREGRVADGRGWIGLADRQAYQLRDIRQVELAPAWAMLLLSAGLVLAAWRIEGK